MSDDLTDRIDGLLDDVPPPPWEQDGALVLRDNGWGPPVADCDTEEIAALIAAAPSLLAEARDEITRLNAVIDAHRGR